MKVNLKCFSKLVNPDTCDFNESTTYDLDEGHTVKDLVQRAGIDGEDVKIAFVNSRIVDLDTTLSEGDRPCQRGIGSGWPRPLEGCKPSPPILKPPTTTK
jgi:sulfur carrier protein ThiS